MVRCHDNNKIVDKEGLVGARKKKRKIKQEAIVRQLMAFRGGVGYRGEGQAGGIDREEH